MVTDFGRHECIMHAKRAMSSAQARYIKQSGHDDEKDFAKCLGIWDIHVSSNHAKKDVVDTRGYAYSVKSGKKKWQIFLYSKIRFQTDPDFMNMNNIGRLFLQCIDSFPESRYDYLLNKIKYKIRLQTPMKQLCVRLQDEKLLARFIDKSMFNNGEVDFLVVKDGGVFHVFWREEVVHVLAHSYEVENSRARRENQVDAQKVVFKVDGKTHGEIEVRKDSDSHYRQIKFWLSKPLTLGLLKNKIKRTYQLNSRVTLYGKAINKLLKLQ